MFEVFRAYLETKIPITENQFEAIRKLFIPASAQRGEMLLQAGQVCRYDIFVVKGCLRSYVIDQKDREHIVEFAAEGSWISDQESFLEKTPSMFNIDAIEQTEMLLADENFNERIMEIVPGINLMVYSLLQKRIKTIQKRLVNHLCATADERYLDFIKSYPTLANRIPQHMIASYIGVIPQSLSRIRAQSIVKRG